MPADKRLTTFAKEMRKAPTRPEKALWEKLRRNQVHGLRFRRQHPIGPYIVDFVCYDIRLIIELDGAGHDQKVEYDIRRKTWLESQGFVVLRIGSDYRFTDPDEVFPFIEETCRKLWQDQNSQ